MADVHDVSAYIISKLGNMSTMKLQKLCYYSQGWHLAWEGLPLFDSEIEAWRLGPVVRDLYAHHRLKVSVDEWPRGDAAKLLPSERSVIDDVLDGYGQLTGLQLSKLTHEESPWLKTRGSMGPRDSSTEVISLELIEEFFRGLADEDDMKKKFRVERPTVYPPETAETTGNYRKNYKDVVLS